MTIASTPAAPVTASPRQSAALTASPEDQRLLIACYTRDFGRPPNLAQPRRYSEHLLRQLLSADGMDPLRQFVSDKEFAKLYVKAAAGDEYNVKVLALLRTHEEVERFSFPAPCIIKPTHLSAAVLRRREPGPLDLLEIHGWLTRDYYEWSAERNYRYLEPKLIVEEMLQEPGRDNPYDYRVFCFQGIPAWLQVDSDRISGPTRRGFYSPGWQRLPVRDKKELLADTPPPACLDEMLAVAARLSAPFSFIRVDMYASTGGVKVGELTNTPGGCRGPFYPAEADARLGQLFNDPHLDVRELLAGIEVPATVPPQ
jgi:hypothetical protein